MKPNMTQSTCLVVLAGLLLLTGIGCGGATSGTSSGTTTPTPTTPTPTPTQPVAPSVPAGWVNIDRPYFNFSYPSSWQLNESTSTTKPFDNAAEPGLRHQFLVQFELGIVNKPDAISQCAGAVQYLEDYFNTNFEPLEKNVGNYPYTTAHFSLNYGYLGGRGMSITVRSTPTSSGPNFDVWLDAIPRADGMYLVGYRSDPSDSLDVWVAARKMFTDTIVFNKSQALPSTAYCN